MDDEDILALAASLAAGTITQAYITKVYGSAVLAAVLAVSVGYVVEKTVSTVFDSIFDPF